ncbi:MAG: hypothetical protein KC776_08725 [Myxococcales bacterium]|nr:hypothetical protein [Myxococcales bacterium]MCB9576308.1 hypothetical protein [Polyangiaceae bacterium]
MELGFGCTSTRRLDSGGSVEFHRCDHATYGQVCAVIAPPLTWPPWADPALFARLPAEATVVRTFETQLTDARDVVLLEWVEGESLMDRVRRTGPLTRGEALAVMGEVWRALSRLKRGIPLEGDKLLPCAHGHVHPRWVQLGPRQVKLGGWLLGTLKPETEMRVADALLAAAPERLRADDADLHAADVYGLGALLHFALTARGPSGTEPSSMSTRSVDPSLSPELRNFVLELTEPVPQRRPSLEHVGEALARLR